MTRNQTDAFPVLQPNLQISFYHRLHTLKHSYLQEALSETVQKLDLSTLDRELASFVSRKSIGKVASFGLRGEIFFPVPYLLVARPSLLGFYRLLYGLSQKEFYRNRRIAPFKRLEERNELLPTSAAGLEGLCGSLVRTGEALVDGIDVLSLQTVRDLQLLTLGAQLRGGRNTEVGRSAAAEVFSLVESLVHDNLVEARPQKLVLRNAANRTVVVAFSSDPDIAITEELASGPRGIVSIEIKGGTDVSNIHNRIGEAEKSHQKAKGQGFFEFWTILGADVELQMARRESPTTSRFYYLSQLRNREGTEYANFRDHLQSVAGIRTERSPKKKSRNPEL